MSYRVNFRGSGHTAPDSNNPKGIRVTGTGYVIVEGEKPKRNFDIPFEVIERCKRVFMEQCRCVRYSKDGDGFEYFPSVWLGK
jgi:hypothetical protein